MKPTVAEPADADRPCTDGLIAVRIQQRIAGWYRGLGTIDDPLAASGYGAGSDISMTVVRASDVEPRDIGKGCCAVRMN
ncbi:hypothetical protein [Caballeronia grimmiae]|uniref:hypothetical protein n=1 Tax=Caballeronia grimmiae TaxID=1071679 RepID=UPI0038BC139F